jgi:hypothetical protein
MTHIEAPMFARDAAGNNHAIATCLRRASTR